MATKILTIPCPHNPPPNPAHPQVVLTSTDNWSLSVIKGSPHQIIDTTQKFIKVGINTAHFTQFCNAFLEVGPTKNVTFTYSGSVVSAMSFPLLGSPVNITLPDP